MNNPIPVRVRQVLWMLAAVAALLVLGFLWMKTQSVDGALHQERLAHIRAINNLDVELNRTLTQERVASLDAVDDTLVKVIEQLGTAQDALDTGPQNLRGLTPELDKALDTFLDTISEKAGLGFDFKARNILLNQRLINSLTSVPLNADAAAATATGPIKERVGELSNQIKAEIITFAVTPSPTNAPAIRSMLDELKTLADAQPGAFADAVNGLRDRCMEVLEGKTELVDKLNAFLGRASGPQLQAVEQLYTSWHAGQVAIANQYRLYLVGYALWLLLSLTWLGVRLNRSYRSLDRAYEKLTEANEGLETQVQARTKDLSSALTHLRESQAQLLQSEKMASLGQMVAGVAHEINTPLGYARSNTEIVRTSLNDIRYLCAAQNKALNLLTSANASDEEISAAVGDAQTRMAQTNAEELVDDLSNLLSDSDHGLTQISELVAGLKDFSRVDRSRNDLFSVNDGIESALKICHNQLKHRVEVVKQFGKLPNIQCAPSQINQVFLNLFTNAAQAINGNGKIFVHTEAEQDGVAIRILDTGAGMSEEVRARIFEPFFTTKPVGKGTGLGLSIVYRIIEDHGGRITVRSTIGKGTEFSIHLPLKQVPKRTENAPESESAPSPALAAA